MEKNLSDLIHDTANPANSIIKATEYLLSGKATPEETKFLLEKIGEQAKKVNTAVDTYYIAITPKPTKS